MTKLVNRIIKELREEVQTKKILIKRNEDYIKGLSNECTERLDIIKKLEELKLNE